MPTLSYSGRTTRSLFRKISKGINNGNIPSCVAYSSIQRKKTREELQKFAYNILDTLSGGEPMKLLSDALDRNDKMKLEPLKTACNILSYLPHS